MKKLISLPKIKNLLSPCVWYVAFLFFLGIPGLIHADTQRIIDYIYDGAGNIISVRLGQNLGPPDVTALSPAFIHKESFAFVTATGINLTKATVSISTPGISLIDVENVSETEIKLTLFADNTALIGLAAITFTTRLGTDTENIAVTESTPVVSTDPNPIILSPDNQEVTVKLTYDRSFATEQIYDIKVTDETIAQVSTQQITLPSGKTETSVNISGLHMGTTTLEINQLSNFLALVIPVMVIDEPLPAGNYAQFSDPVGVTVFTEDPPGSNRALLSVAQPVGVAATVDQALNTSRLFVTRPVGVATFVDQVLNTNGSFITQPIGVAAFFDQPLNTSGPFVSATVGSTFGTGVEQVTPQLIIRPASTQLTIDGIGLDIVSAISFSPNDGIIQTSPLTISPDGTQITVSIEVSTTASTGSHTILFTTPAGDETFPEGVLEITN